MTLQLRELPAPPEDSIPSTQSRWLPTPCSSDSGASSDLFWSPQAYTYIWHTHRGKHTCAWGDQCQKQSIGRFLQLCLCHLELNGLIRTSPVQPGHVVRVLTFFRGSVTPHSFANVFRRQELLSKLRQHDHRLRKYQFSPGKNVNPLLDKILFILYRSLNCHVKTLLLPYPNRQPGSYAGGKISHTAHKQFTREEN